MAFFSRNTSTAELRAELARLNAAVERQERRVSEQDAPPPTPVPPATDEATAARLSEVEDRLDAIVAQLGQLDVRITSVSRELVNQLTELGNDIETLSARAADELDAEEVEELRDTQLRLANEQARYQFAFRRELAELADQLRRR